MTGRDWERAAVRCWRVSTLPNDPAPSSARLCLWSAGLAQRSAVWSSKFNGLCPCQSAIPFPGHASHIRPSSPRQRPYCRLSRKYKHGSTRATQAAQDRSTNSAPPGIPQGQRIPQLPHINTPHMPLRHDFTDIQRPSAGHETAD